MATLKIDDVFFFSDGRTVITGKLDEPIKATTATVALEGAEVGSIRLSGERMGPSSREHRAVETVDIFPWDRSMVASGKYELRWPSEDRRD